MKGQYVFLNDKYERVEYTDYNDIPEDVEFRHIIKFVCDFPPPPHTLEEHVLLSNFNTLLSKYMKRVYGR